MNRFQQRIRQAAFDRRMAQMGSNHFTLQTARISSAKIEPPLRKTIKSQILKDGQPAAIRKTPITYKETITLGRACLFNNGHGNRGNRMLSSPANMRLMVQALITTRASRYLPLIGQAH